MEAAAALAVRGRAGPAYLPGQAAAPARRTNCSFSRGSSRSRDCSAACRAGGPCRRCRRFSGRRSGRQAA